MKSGYLIVVGVILWFVSAVSESFVLYQYKIHIGTAIFVGLSSIYWLTKIENRQTLERTFFPSKYGIDKYDFLERIRHGLFSIGLTTLFVLITILAESARFLVSTSEGFRYIEEEVTNNSDIHHDIGQVTMILLGGSYSSNTSFSTSEKRIKVSLLVFGDRGKIKADVTALKQGDKWRVISFDRKN
jgi:hypothetical protein